MLIMLHELVPKKFESVVLFPQIKEWLSKKNNEEEYLSFLINAFPEGIRFDADYCGGAANPRYDFFGSRNSCFNPTSNPILILIGRIYNNNSLNPSQDYNLWGTIESISEKYGYSICTVFASYGGVFTENNGPYYLYQLGFNDFDKNKHPEIYEIINDNDFLLKRIYNICTNIYQKTTK